MKFLSKTVLVKVALCLMWSASALASDLCIGLQHNSGDGYVHYRLHCDGVDNGVQHTPQDVISLAKESGLTFIKSFFQEKVFIFTNEAEVSDSLKEMCVTASHQVDTAGKIWVRLGWVESKYRDFKRTDCGNGAELNFQDLRFYKEFKDDFENAVVLPLRGRMLGQNMLFRFQLASENEALEFLY